MAPRRKLRELIGIVKDKASLIKSTLSTKRTTSSIHNSVLRATTHTSTSSPQEHRIAAILSLGHDSRPTACICIEAIMDRLHNTHNAYVALKCLIVLHNIIIGGSFILKDQLSVYPYYGGRNFLNLSRFRDKTDFESLEFSSWVRWYVSVLERNLVTSRVLGSYFSSSTSLRKGVNKDTGNLSLSMDSDLLKEIDALVNMIEEICRAPEESLHYKKNNLIYDVMRLVGEDYGSTQYQVMPRLTELMDRMGGLGSNECVELTCCLKRIEECKERLMLLFGNRKRNDAFWELISETKRKLVNIREERERESLLVVTRLRKEDERESTRFRERVLEPTQTLRSLTYGSKWLGRVDHI